MADDADAYFASVTSPKADPGADAYFGQIAAAAKPAPAMAAKAEEVDPWWQRDATIAAGMIPGVGSALRAAGVDMSAYDDAKRKIGYGVVKGAADVGNTVANVIDVPAQFLENRFGTLGGPSVADARAVRDASNVQYEQDTAGSNAALLGRVVGSTALVAPVLAQAGAGLAGNSLIRAGGAALRGWSPAAANIASGAAQGAAGAAMTSGGYNAPASEQIGTGALFGGALGIAAPVVRKVAGDVYRRFAGQPAQAAQAASPAATQAAESLKIDPAKVDPQVLQNATAEAEAQSGIGKLDSGAVARRLNLEHLGLKPTTGMVNRDPLEWATEREMAKTPEGKPLADTIAHNNKVLRDHLQKIGDETQGATENAYDAGESVIRAIKAKFGESQGDVSQAYAAVREGGEGAPVQLSRLQEDMAPHSDSTAGIPITDAIKRRLTRYGVIDGNGQWTGQLTVQKAEELRKFIAGEAGNSAEGGRITRDLQRALDDDVFNSTGSDAFGEARGQARARFAEIESSKINSDVMDGKIRPDDLFDRYIVGKSAGAEDLAALRNTLTSGNNLQMQRGTQAWNDLRQQTARYIMDRATNGNAAEGAVSFPKLRDALTRIGTQRLRLLFGDEGMQQYVNLAKAAHDSTFAPPGAPVNYSNTANELGRRMKELVKKAGEHSLMGGLLTAPHDMGAGALVAAAGKGAAAVVKGAEKRAAEKAVSNTLLGPGKTAAPPPKPAPTQQLPPSLQGVVVPANVGYREALAWDANDPRRTARNELVSP